MEKKSWNVFIKNLNFFSTEERMTWISWMTWGVSKLSAKVFFFKVNNSFKVLIKFESYDTKTLLSEGLKLSDV